MSMYNPLDASGNVKARKVPLLFTQNQRKLEAQRRRGRSHVTPLVAKRMGQYESADYAVNESDVHMDYEKRQSTMNRKMKYVARWFIVFLIGVCTALVAFFIDYFTRLISRQKFDWVQSLLGTNPSSPRFWLPFVAFVAMNFGLVLIASCLVAFIEPVAAGSGIPEIKCYLNGNKIPRVIRAKTLVSKAVGVLFSVSGGLVVGKEGPMIHSGAIIAGGLSQGKSSTMAFDTSLFKHFRNDREKRDFVSCGAAAGVSAAFGAPVGGVLFALEEGASFWNQSLTWRVFFCSMVSSFTLNVFLSGESGAWGQLSQPGLVNFGAFAAGEQPGYTIWQIPLFIVLGAFGGLMGACFNKINKHLTLVRMRYITEKHRYRRVMEALFVGLLTAVCVFTFSFYLNYCRPLPDDPFTAKENLRYFGCVKGTFNDMATLLFNSQEDAITMLFHSKGEFSAPTLALFCILYFFIGMITYGIAVPSGLFVPCLLVGSAYGRLFGNLLVYLFPNAEISPGTFAVIGAASMLGGVARMTISLTVILVESTNDIQYMLPFIIVIVIAKWVGDLFNHGIYDIHIHLKNVPFLEWDAPVVPHVITAKHIMTTNVVTLKIVDKVSNIVQVLRRTQHNGFPVTEGLPDGRGDPSLKGIILRRDLCSLLVKKPFFHLRATDQASGLPPKLVTEEELNAAYPWYPDIEDIALTKEEQDMYLDLSPYMNRSPYLVQEEATLASVFILFRTMGLRHLIVVDHCHEVVGIITRFNIALYMQHDVGDGDTDDMSDDDTHPRSQYSTMPTSSINMPPGDNGDRSELRSVVSQDSSLGTSPMNTRGPYGGRQPPHLSSSHPNRFNSGSLPHAK